MAKLYFRYGTVGSAKTLNLLAVAHNYRQQGKEVYVIKPKMDTRWDVQTVRSRAGLECPADLLVGKQTELDGNALENIDCILVDEAQFLPEKFIEQLREVTVNLNIPVICYGLRTDFRTTLFAGARRLLELSDAIEEIKTTCAFCNKKAIYNLKLLDGTPTTAGPSIELGAEEKYLPACHRCYAEKVDLASAYSTSP